MSLENIVKKELIIIDDDTATTYFHAKLAEQTKYFTSIYSFNSAENAIDFLTRQQSNNNLFSGAIIVDVHMDNMDGLEFLDVIENRGLVAAVTEVLVLTGGNTGQAEEKTKASDLSANFSIKPLTNNHLLMIAQ
jgi:CheY-like chemotaxis protein